MGDVEQDVGGQAQPQVDLNAVLQGLTQQNQMLINQNAQLQERLTNLEASFAGVSAKGMGKGKPATTGDGVPGALVSSSMDLKTLSNVGKPDQLKSESQWFEWSTIFRSYASLVHVLLEALMREAEDRDPKDERGEFMTNTMMSLNPEKVQASKQLYFILLMLCRGEPLDIVNNAGQHEGLVAWKKLCNRFEPAVRTRLAGLLLELLRYDFSGDIMARLESWEREVTRWEKRAGEPITKNIRIGIVLISLEEGPIKQHLLLHSSKYDSWDAFKLELIDLKRAQDAAHGVAPMEVDALGGKKGGGKKDKSQIECHNCHKKGHYKSECRQPGGGAYRAQGVTQAPKQKGKAAAKKK